MLRIRACKVPAYGCREEATGGPMRRAYRDLRKWDVRLDVYNSGPGDIVAIGPRLNKQLICAERYSANSNWPVEAVSLMYFDAPSPSSLRIVASNSAAPPRRRGGRVSGHDPYLQAGPACRSPNNCPGAVEPLYSTTRCSSEGAGQHARLAGLPLGSFTNR